MTITEITPTIRQFEYLQEKGDKDYGSCLWAIFNIDTKNYTLSIESDCGNFSYGWVPTPKSEHFIHLLSRIRENYLLHKIAERTEFDYESSKTNTLRNIEMVFEDEPDTVEAIKRDIEWQEGMSDMKDSAYVFYHVIEEILSNYDATDIHEYIECEMDYTAQAKRVTNIFCTVVQPILIKECIKENKG